MKTIILCGGHGTRMKEETEFKPKPLVLVGGKPILWHIMKIYAHHGFNEFILALGYKGDMIKQYFLNERAFNNNFTLDTKTGEIAFHNGGFDDFKITFVDTGLSSLTGERVRQLKSYIGNEDFMLTYGDGVGNINMGELVKFHKKQKTIATITGVKPSMRFGFLDINHDTKKVNEFYQHQVTDFSEHNEDDRGYINGGFMVFQNKIFDFIKPDSMVESVFVPLAKERELSIYIHPGRWKCMDTHKEVEELNRFYQANPFWKVWDSNNH